jgi:hypothetical protein
MNKEGAVILFPDAAGGVKGALKPGTEPTKALSSARL